VSHPQQFSANDPVLARLREICLGLPGAEEKVSHGRPCFFTRKIFCIYGAVTKGEHHAGDHDQSMVFLPDDDEVPAYEQDDRFFVPAYWGPHGWWGLDLDPDTDWDEVAELVDASFRLTAPKKLVAELEERAR
jgi:predicted DNA-binding protein (MmcQ/YjbR family)